VDRLRQRLSLASRAVTTLRELALRQGPTKVERDAAIQRFEYSFEATWKAAQRFLALVEGIEAGSPKSAVRACQQVGLLSLAEAERALVMTDDRNLTAHTYNEALADAIFGRLSGHLAALEAWTAAMQKRMAGSAEP
jgi:nucleotidyltransferase substrate binding protein (TIGR01987 family)